MEKNWLWKLNTYQVCPQTKWLLMSSSPLSTKTFGGIVSQSVDCTENCLYSACDCGLSREKLFEAETQDLFKIIYGARATQWSCNNQHQPWGGQAGVIWGHHWWLGFSKSQETDILRLIHDDDCDVKYRSVIFSVGLFSLLYFKIDAGLLYFDSRLSKWKVRTFWKLSICVSFIDA